MKLRKSKSITIPKPDCEFPQLACIENATYLNDLGRTVLDAAYKYCRPKEPQQRLVQLLHTYKDVTPFLTDSKFKEFHTLPENSFDKRLLFFQNRSLIKWPYPHPADLFVLTPKEEVLAHGYYILTSINRGASFVTMINGFGSLSEVDDRMTEWALISALLRARHYNNIEPIVYCVEYTSPSEFSILQETGFTQLPHNSLFILPASELEAAIVATHGLGVTLAETSIQRVGLHSWPASTTIDETFPALGKYNHDSFMKIVGILSAANPLKAVLKATENADLIVDWYVFENNKPIMYQLLLNEKGFHKSFNLFQKRDNTTLEISQLNLPLLSILQHIAYYLLPVEHKKNYMQVYPKAFAAKKTEKII